MSKLEKVVWMRIKKHQYSFFFNLQLFKFLNRQESELNIASSAKQRNKSHQDTTYSHRTSMITADRSNVPPESRRVGDGERGRPAGLSSQNARQRDGQGSSPSQENDFMTTQMTPHIDMTDRSMLYYGATGGGDRDSAQALLGATPTTKDKHVFDRELRQSRSYR